MNPIKAASRIRELIEACESGLPVSRRDLARVVTPKLLRKYDEEWNNEKSSRKTLVKPASLIKYESMLSGALLAHGKYEKQLARVDARTSSKSHQRAEQKFLHALEFLQDIVSADAELRVWLDRDPFSEASPDPIGMPRLRTSKSFENRSKGHAHPHVERKSNIKLRVLNEMLEELVPTEPGTELGTDPLGSMPKRLRKRNFDDFKF